MNRAQRDYEKHIRSNVGVWLYNEVRKSYIVKLFGNPQNLYIITDVLYIGEYAVKWSRAG